MRKSLLLSVLFIFFCSCRYEYKIDLKEGKYQIENNLSISKEMLDFFDNSDKSTTDLKREIKDEINNLCDEITKDYPQCVTSYSEKDDGIQRQARLEIDKNTTNAREKRLLPIMNGSVCEIKRFYDTQNFKQNIELEDIVFLRAFDLKYSLLVSKAVVPYASFATISVPWGKVYIEAVDDEDFYRFEISSSDYFTNENSAGSIFIETNPNASIPPAIEGVDSESMDKELILDWFTSLFHGQSNTEIDSDVSKGIGPFGLEMGMNIDEIDLVSDLEPEHIEDDFFKIYPTNTHSRLDYYYALIDPREGLYRIVAGSDDIKSNDYGKEVRAQFDYLRDSLEKKYGEFELIDEVDERSYLKEDKYWLMSLRDGVRTYKAMKYFSEKQNGYGGLVSVTIYADSDDYDSGNVGIVYVYNNSFAVSDSDDENL